MKPIRILIALAGCSAACLAQAVIHVAPDGNDDGPGSRERPLRTLERARAEVRARKAGGLPRGGVQVCLAPGTYALDRPLQFTAEDSGAPGEPVVYAGCGGEPPVVTAGRAIGGWRQSGHLWTAQIPEARDGKWRFEQLYVNGRRAQRARHPNRFYFHVDLAGGWGVPPGRTGPVELSRWSIRLDEDGALNGLDRLSESELNDVTATILHFYKVSKRRLGRVAPERNEMVFTTEGTRVSAGGGDEFADTAAQFDRGKRLFLENARMFLDAPGEWFLSRDGELSYFPLPGEDLAGISVVAPVADGFAVLRGASHVEFRGIRFEHAGWSLGENYFDRQSCPNLRGAIDVEYGEGIAIEDCELAHIGPSAIVFGLGCRNSRVARSLIRDTGGSAIRIGIDALSSDSRLRDARNHTSGIAVHNNILHGIGREFFQASAIVATQAFDIQITHNDVADLYYIPLSVGWSWTWEKSHLARNNQVAFNRVHHFGWGVMSDFGGIYTLGWQPGTIIENNVIHDAFGASYGGGCLYNDQSSGAIAMRNNICYNTMETSYALNQGSDLILENNIFASSLMTMLRRSDQSSSGVARALEARRNIFYMPTGNLFDSRRLWTASDVTLEGNLYFHLNGESAALGETFDSWARASRDAASRFADPLFVDPENGDFTLKPGSPAFELGFVPIDAARAGVEGPDSWRARVFRSDAPYPPLDWAEPPYTVRQQSSFEDFEEKAAGAPPSYCRVNLGVSGASIAVSEDRGFASAKSLKFVDIDRGDAWKPALQFFPYHREGLSRISMDVYMEEGSSFNIQGRSQKWAVYTYGPMISISNGRLQAGSQSLPVPRNGWFRLEILIPLGSRRSGSFEVRVTPEEGVAQALREVRFSNSAFAELHELILSAAALRSAVFYLDNVRVFSE